MSKNFLLFAALLLLVATPLKASAKTIHVSVTDEGFRPSGLDAGEEITINVGDTVVWTLKSANSHNVEDGDFENHACFGEGLSHTFTAFGEKYSHTFTTPGDCYYRCNVHPPDMRGMIHVIGDAGPASGPSKENCKNCKDKDKKPD